MEYKGYRIEPCKWTVTYGSYRSQFTHYVVCRCIDHNKCFLPEKTAFDTVEEAREAIDNLIAKAANTNYT